MKKLIIPFGIVIIILLSYIIFTYLPKQLGRICNFTVSKETRLECINGDTGKKIIISNIDEIQKIFGLLEKATVARQLDQRPRGGYSYMLTQYEDNKSILNIIIMNDIIKVNNVYYKAGTDLAADLKNSGILYESYK
jgi:hypothetical protein